MFYNTFAFFLNQGCESVDECEILHKKDSSFDAIFDKNSGSDIQFSYKFGLYIWF